MAITRGLAFFDSHWGYEVVGRKRRPLHDPKAHEVMLQIAQEFEPQLIVMGGDGLDCGAAGHWNRGKPRLTEGLRLQEDAEDYFEHVIGPLSTFKGEKAYLLGNHEDWVEQFVDENPSIEGLVNIDEMLGLTLNGWDVYPRGSVINHGKLHFMHGDTVRSTTFPARYAVDTYGRSIAFGHFHTPQSYTKVSALDSSDVHVGKSVGCLCRKDPSYGRGAPNRWAQSFLLFEVESPSGRFQTYEVNITEGQALYNGRRYRG